ncbi:bZIP transcription factor [Halorubrum sp. Boch-26]|uniref:DUF7518 family protein n=1 Tax=Halorubrum sp. Boch-26 TaxID=2994426 RepID=UPI002468A4DD|nr:bZIP transcription factor [Halorubrum sp. Boch-26]
MSNRVEDLERQVAELQAAVNGLTEELVEMKERVRQVEDAQEVSVAADAAGEGQAAAEAAEEQATATESSGGETRTHSDDHVEVVERTGDEGTADGKAGADAEGDDDMVVPEQAATTPDAEAGKSEAEGDEEESDSDIIVA